MKTDQLPLNNAEARARLLSLRRTIEESGGHLQTEEELDKDIDEMRRQT